MLQPDSSARSAHVGVAWFLVAAVALFSRLLARTDELQRHIYIDGAAMGYALFERWLPALRAQSVTMSLLLFWWVGWQIAALRYR